MAGILEVVRPLTVFVPEIESPRAPVPYKKRATWTVICLFFFLVCCQIPLFGIQISDSADPFSFIRSLVASNRGTLMELGISPIVTASMIMQLLIGLGIVQIDRTVKEDVVLAQRVEKLLALLLTAAEAVVYILSGMYGPMQQLGPIRIVLIFVQLMAAGVIVMLLDEVLQKGYGIGSGISLFIATNVCENIVWKALSPIAIQTQRGTEFEGAIIATFHAFFTKPFFQAVYLSFFRSGNPNLLNLIATIVVFLVVIYCQNLRVDLPVVVKGQRGDMGSHSIKLFYTSNTPIILLSSAIGNITLISRTLHRAFPENFFVSLFGSWEDLNGHSFPRGGFAYYLYPPSFTTMFFDPIHAIIYTLIILTSCAALATVWLHVSKSSAKDVHEQFKLQNREIAGFPGNSTYHILNKYIPTAAAFGGIAVGLLTIFSDLVGAIGSGTSLLLTANILSGYVFMIAEGKEELQEF